ncbi:PIG-L family deacetylase [Saccharothrix obliqua]|uniref:PIG-L family deacetylase n=1 Tax=Saccharothrix obliqua TaxID=2861747 RepID=UPI001C5F46E8|nr:PIG-L family deacetylase [Saccharothrix obliqua]MBW4719099.1 PIG-L family deacetylase [Saccharothrix obliqua]
MTTTVSFVAHPDDDLLFMSPDVLSDVRAGFGVWVVYLSAGDLPCGEGFRACGMEYADMRIHGERAAYARAANVANRWTFEELSLGGHRVATNTLDGTGVRLAFMFIHAAGGSDQVGDLARMVLDGGFQARPIDGRAPYTRDSFLGVLRDLLRRAGPDYVRTLSTVGHREGDRDHVDHTAAAILAALADRDEHGRTWIRRDEYDGYVIRQRPENWSGFWRDEKAAAWREYRRHDPELGPNDWDEVMERQYRQRVFEAGDPWTPPDDFSV